MKHFISAAKASLLFAFIAVFWAAIGYSAPVTVKGYVLDSACAFTKGLDKPISRECATSCANAGSPRAVRSDGETDPPPRE